MRYYGSAMRTPHVQGAFRQQIVVETSQAHRLADDVSDGEGSMAEPLSVALHAVQPRRPAAGQARAGHRLRADRRAGRHRRAPRRRRRTSSPPTSARTRCARRCKVGADEAINVAEQPDAPGRASRADKGQFDVLFEASGNERALRGAFDALRPRGIIVQLGLGGEMTLPINTIVAKEFDLRGAFRFHEEFAVAVELLNKGLVDVKPLISATLPYRDAARAFALAADRSQAMKVLLSFD